MAEEEECRKHDDVSLLGGQWCTEGSNSPKDLVRGAVFRLGVFARVAGALS